jgi:hypothetical protein
VAQAVAERDTAGLDFAEQAAEPGIVALDTGGPSTAATDLETESGLVAEQPKELRWTRAKTAAQRVVAAEQEEKIFESCLPAAAAGV